VRCKQGRYRSHSDCCEIVQAVWVAFVLAGSLAVHATMMISKRWEVVRIFGIRKSFPLLGGTTFSLQLALKHLQIAFMLPLHHDWTVGTFSSGRQSLSVNVTLLASSDTSL
jgi:hypothetical protein